MNFSYYFIKKWQLFWWRLIRNHMQYMIMLKNISLSQVNFFYFPIDFSTKKYIGFYRGINYCNELSSYVPHILRNYKYHNICLIFLRNGKFDKHLIEDSFIAIQNKYYVILQLKGIGNRIEYSKDKNHLLFKLNQSNLLQLPAKSSLFELTLLDHQTLIISGSSKEKVHNIASKIRALKTIDCYKGKGFKYFIEIDKLRKIQK
jgi:hypothetical protein